LDLKKVKKA
jgi:hypothetical protein